MKVKFTEIEGLTTIEKNGRAFRKVPSRLALSDKLGSWKVRLGINRMKYRVEPGIYMVGNPLPESPVLVTANYKMSFDILRSAMDRRDCWILVLNTFGINVWCAAGKGTFGTDELVRQVREAKLHDVVSHRNLIIPQLGAPGVSAHKVKLLAAFRVVFGPVRAEDIPDFLDAGMKATTEMRRVRFTLRDRAVLIPVEISLTVLLMLAGLLMLLPLDLIMDKGTHFWLNKLSGVWVALAGYLGGTVIGPLLLPWIPGRAFSLKGMWVGLIIAIVLGFLNYGNSGFGWNIWELLGWTLLLPVISSFMLMQFTGSSTYTSFSGVRKEMKIAVPLQLCFGIAGLIILAVGSFI